LTFRPTTTGDGIYNWLINHEGLGLTIVFVGNYLIFAVGNEDSTTTSFLRTFTTAPTGADIVNFDRFGWNTYRINRDSEKVYSYYVNGVLVGSTDSGTATPKNTIREINWYFNTSRLKNIKMNDVPLFDFRVVQYNDASGTIISKIPINTSRNITTL
jgi:hypothetical protein